MKHLSIAVDGQRISFDWNSDDDGSGGMVTALPGVIDFHADSLDEARNGIRGLFSRASLKD